MLVVSHRMGRSSMDTARRVDRWRRAGVLVCLSAMPALSVFAQPLTVSRQERSVEPVVLRGMQFPTWSAGPDPAFREPSTPHEYDIGDVEQYLPALLQSDCYRKGGQYPTPYDPDDVGDHNCDQSSRLPRNPQVGAAV